MKHIRLFEDFRIKNTYLYGRDLLFINDVMNYLKVDTLSLDVQHKLESPYDIDIIDFFKEIFLDKYVIFNPINKNLKGVTSTIKDKVENVKFFEYKYDVYIQVKFYNDDTWYLMPDDQGIFVENYDADTKSLHKEVEIKKQAEKYNL